MAAFSWILVTCQPVGRWLPTFRRNTMYQLAYTVPKPRTASPKFISAPPYTSYGPKVLTPSSIWLLIEILERGNEAKPVVFPVTSVTGFGVHDLLRI